MHQCADEYYNPAEFICSHMLLTSAHSKSNDSLSVILLLAKNTSIFLPHPGCSASVESLSNVFWYEKRTPQPINFVALILKLLHALLIDKLPSEPSFREMESSVIGRINYPTSCCFNINKLIVTSTKASYPREFLVKILQPLLY